MLTLSRPLQYLVSSFLSVGDAVALASTCKDLQDISESRIWRELDLRFDALCSDSTLYVKASSNLVSEATTELPVGKVDLLQGTMEYLSALLIARPQRQTYVRTFRVTCQRYKWDGRQHLDWPDNENEVGESWEEEENDRLGAWLRTKEERSKSGPISQPSLAKTFANFPILHGVRQLEMELSEAWGEYMIAWRRILPDITFLRIRTSPRLTGTSQTIGDCEVWTNLQGLDIDLITNELADFIISLLRINRNVRSLTIGGVRLTGFANRIETAENGLREAIKDLKIVKELYIPDHLRGL